MLSIIDFNYCNMFINLLKLVLHIRYIKFIETYEKNAYSFYQY